MQFIVYIFIIKRYNIYIVIVSGGKILITEKIKIFRTEKNLTQEQLAEKVGVTRQTIGLIEKGKYNPSICLCIKIAKVLDRTLDDLFWEVERSDKT